MDIFEQMVDGYTHDLTEGIFEQNLLSLHWVALASEYKFNLIQRQIFYLSFGIGHTDAQVAQCLNIPNEEVKMGKSSIQLIIGEYHELKIFTIKDIYKVICEKIDQRRSQLRTLPKL